MALADQAVRGPVAARHAEAPALGAVALAHPLGELAAVRLGLVGLADELVPVAGVAREQPLVGEQDGDARGREVVLDRDERLLEVAQERSACPLAFLPRTICGTLIWS